MSERLFNFNLPLEIYKDKNKNWRIKGLASTEDRDLQGEIIKQNGLDISDLKSGRGYINWEHKNDPQNIIGLIDNAEITEKGLMVEGQLFNKHDQAKAVYQMLDSLDDNRKHRIQMSVEGKVISKADDKESNAKIVEKAKLTAVALTMNPVNTSTYAELVKSLTASSELKNTESLADQPAGGEFDSSFSPSAPLLDTNNEDNKVEKHEDNTENKEVIEKNNDTKENEDIKKEEEIVKVEEKNDETIISKTEKLQDNNTNIIDNKMVNKDSENVAKEEEIIKNNSNDIDSIKENDIIEVLKYIDDKILEKSINPVLFLANLKQRLLKAEDIKKEEKKEDEKKSDAEIEMTVIDDIDSNNIAELFNDLKNTLSTSYTYDVLDKFNTLKSNFDKYLKLGDSQKIQKLQNNFFNWYDRLHASKDERYSDVAGKVKSLAVAFNTLIDSLKKKEHEVKQQEENTKKSIEELKNIIKSKI